MGPDGAARGRPRGGRPGRRAWPGGPGAARPAAGPGA